MSENQLVNLRNLFHSLEPHQSRLFAEFIDCHERTTKLRNFVEVSEEEERDVSEEEFNRLKDQLSAMEVYWSKLYDRLIWTDVLVRGD